MSPHDAAELPLQAARNAQVAFYLTGAAAGATPDTFAALRLRPALFATRRDLTALRYDFPLVLRRGRNDATAVETLSGLVDAALAAHADRPDIDRLRHHAHMLERALRQVLADCGHGRFGTLRMAAMERLEAGGTPGLADSLRALGSLPHDADLVDCDRAMPGRLVGHLWAAAQQPLVARMRAEIERLTLKIAEILDAAQARSDAGRTPDALRASFGGAHAQVFDFVAFSRVLARAAPAPELPETRWRRLHWLLNVLQSQRFFPAAEADAGAGYSFRFSDMTDAIRAWRERVPKAIELAKAMAIASLEVTGEYDDARHDPVFADFGARGLEAALAASFPTYLIQLDATQITAADVMLALDALDAGLPVKLLLQTDDILAPSALGDGACTLGRTPRQLAAAALAAGDVFVLQASAARLFRQRDRLFAGLAGPGPALISVFSGASGQNDLIPPYLLAAAATESRAFPSFSYDPQAGADWASRFSLDGNTQAERDWPVHALTYQDADCQAVRETAAFTLVDLLACDRRYRGDFAEVPRLEWNERMVPVADGIAATDRTAVPYVLMSDEQNRLHKVVADARLIRAARRCLALWHALREQGGIGNAYAARAVAAARAEWEVKAPPSAPTPGAEAPVAAPAMPTEAAPVEPERSPDEAYIETARCSSCNECIQLNGKMFAYNADKQAYIADATAGTFRQLVQAAESCQVAVIHPGKPRNPTEPGLEELLARAAAFA